MADPRRSKYNVGDTAACRSCSDPFVVNESMVRNGRYVCIKCQSKKVRDWRLRNIEHSRTTSRRNSKNQSKRRAGRTAAYRAANPEKRAAHQAVQTALRNGSLVRQPCKDCGTAKAHAHHDDYSKPLDIEWLCHRCHMKAHGRLIAALDKAQP